MPVNDLYDAPFALLDGGRDDAPAYIALAKRYGVPLVLTAHSAADVKARREAAERAQVRATIAGSIEAVGADLLTAAGSTLADVRDHGRALGVTEMPFALELCVNEAGTLHDGTALAQAIALLDEDAALRPWHYTLLCAHPQHAQVACEALFRAAPGLAHRVVGVRSHSAAQFAHEMQACAERFGLQLLGGADGTNAGDLAELAELMLQRR